MSDYRRWYVAGGTYFFTVVTYQRRPLFRIAEARELLGQILRRWTTRKPVQAVAMVLLPDHLHCIWSMPLDDQDFSTRWKHIKRDFTHEWLLASGRDTWVSRAKRARGRRGVWQPRFWEHLIRDADDLERHCDYIHFNPVKHGCVPRPWAWPWSTFRRFVRAGQYEREWGGQEPASIRGMDLE